MDRIEKTVFISYRRNDESWGLAVFQDLTQHGYDVFIDYDGIASGKFQTIILENIRARAHFLVLLTPTALDRCSDPKDWMRREIEAALDSQRNIVPLILAGFDFDAPATASQLTGKLAALKNYNGLVIPKGYFAPAMQRLRSKFLNVPVDAVLHPASNSAQRVAKEQKDKAAMAPQALLGAATMGGNDEQGENSKDKRRTLWPAVVAVTGTLFALTTGLATLTDAIPKIWNTTKSLVGSASVAPTKETPPSVTQPASQGMPQDASTRSGNKEDAVAKASVSQKPPPPPASPTTASPEPTPSGKTVVSDSDTLARASSLSASKAAAQCDPKSDTETRLIGCTAIILRGENPRVTLADALDTRCWAYNDLGQFQRALEDCKASIDRSPSSAYPYNNLGTSYLGLGDASSAITAFTQSIKLKPTFLFAYLGRAKAYVAISNAEMAKKDFQQVLLLDPTNQEAKKGLAALNVP
jgi:TIR domain-containing protein/tetratricopeptide repeat protein